MYEYSAPARRLRFAPRVAAPDFRSLFTAGTAWGTVRISAREAVVQVEAGELTLQRLEIGERVHELTPPAVIRPGRPLTVPCRWYPVVRPNDLAEEGHFNGPPSSASSCRENRCGRGPRQVR